MRWEGQWIWRSREVQINDFAYFRKEFQLAEQPDSAQLYMSCHHYAHVYVNGIRLGGYGTPAPTNPLKRKLYTVHEVAGLLHRGMNCITADAHYLGEMLRTRSMDSPDSGWNCTGRRPEAMASKCCRTQVGKYWPTCRIRQAPLISRKEESQRSRPMMPGSWTRSGVMQEGNSAHYVPPRTPHL